MITVFICHSIYMTLQGTSNNSGISMEHMQNMHVWKYCFVILLFIGAYIMQIK